MAVIGSVDHTASSTVTPTDSSSSTGEPQRLAEETISTSTLSVADYFKQKMREKLRARQRIAGDASLPVSAALESSADSKDEWKGQKTTFDESDSAVITSLGGESAALEAPPVERAVKPKKKRKAADEPEEDRSPTMKVKKSTKDKEERERAKGPEEDMAILAAPHPPSSKSNKLKKATESARDPAVPDMPRTVSETTSEAVTKKMRSDKAAKKAKKKEKLEKES